MRHVPLVRVALWDIEIAHLDDHSMRELSYDARMAACQSRRSHPGKGPMRELPQWDQRNRHFTPLMLW